MVSRIPDYDVIVVGAGPAGSTCARFLGEKHDRVLVVDKASFPRDKICGDAISGKSMRVLEKLGLKERLDNKPHSKIHGVIFTSPSGASFTVRLPTEKTNQHGYVMRREVFDNVLFEHATKVCEFRQKAQVVGIRRENNRMYVKVADLSTKETKEVSCSVVVGADSAVSTIARALNAHELPPAHGCVAIRQYFENIQGLTDNIEIHFVDELIPGYFWIFPMEEGKANVGMGMVLKDLHRKHVILPEVMKKITQHPRFFPRFSAARELSPVLGWTLPFGSQKRKMAFDNAVLIGDAASLVDPFTGEGIGNALVSAQIAAMVIHEAIQRNDFSEGFLSQYEKKVWDILGPELETSTKLQRWLRHRFVINLGFSKAAKNPRVAEYLSSMLFDEKPRKELVNPLTLVKLLLS